MMSHYELQAKAYGGPPKPHGGFSPLWARQALIEVLKVIDRMNAEERCCYDFDENNINTIANFAREGLRTF